MPQNPASGFLQHIIRNWPNPDCRFHPVVSISRIDPVLCKRETRETGLADSLNRQTERLSLEYLMDTRSPCRKIKVEGVALYVNIKTQNGLADNKGHVRRTASLTMDGKRC